MASVNAVVFARGDDGSSPRVIQVAAPGEPGRGEVLVRVTAFPVHPGDLSYRGVSGSAGGGPVDAGHEAMGVVEAVGPAVPPETGITPGARVTFFPVAGAWRERIIVPSDLVVPVPDAMSDDAAAQLVCNPLTAVLLRREVAAAGLASPGGVVLHTAAGSAVGRLVTTALREQGVTSIGLVRSEPGARLLEDRFPDVPVISTADADWREQVRERAEGRPVSAVLDAVGGALAGDLLGLLAPGGTFVLYSALSGEPMTLEATPLVFDNLTIRAVNAPAWALADSAPRQRARVLAEAVALATRAADHLEVAGHYDLAKVAEAVEHAVRPGKSGTVLVHID